jgi:hypothetical protein
MTDWSSAGVVMTPAAEINGVSRVTAVVTSPGPRARIFVRVAAGE